MARKETNRTRFRFRRTRWSEGGSLRAAVSDFERKFKVPKIVKVSKRRIKVNGYESPHELPEMYKSLVRTPNATQLSALSAPAEEEERGRVSVGYEIKSRG